MFEKWWKKSGIMLRKRFVGGVRNTQKEKIKVDRQVSVQLKLEIPGLLQKRSEGW